MKQITKVYNVFKLDELSKDAQSKAHENYMNNNEFIGLYDFLDEIARQELNENGIKDLTPNGFKLFYSLSYSQGDGSQINGTFEIDGRTIKIRQEGHYYHERAINYTEQDENGDELENKYFDLFQKIFKQLTKEGYAYIENENSIETFKEIAEMNEYEFLENGRLF